MVKAVRSGNRPMKRLALLISLNVAYSSAELMIGLLTGRVGMSLCLHYALLTSILLVLMEFQQCP